MAKMGRKKQWTLWSRIYDPSSNTVGPWEWEAHGYSYKECDGIRGWLNTQRFQKGDFIEREWVSMPPGETPQTQTKR